MRKISRANVRVLAAVVVLGMAAAGSAAADEAASPISVHGGAGVQASAGGSSQALSVGFSPSARLEFLVSAERIHLPTDVTRYEHGYAATRGGTTTFISGEVRFTPLTVDRVSPYVLAGAGRGTSRPNVNDLFPDSSRSDAGLLFAGGGLYVPLAGHLSAFADLRFVLQVDRSESGVFLFLPVRGGLAWRF
jgi:hypothetical protein